MVMYRKILELYFNGYSQRTIASSVGSSRRTISNVIKRSIAHEFTELTHEMTDEWLAGLLFPEKKPVEKGYAPLQLDWIHSELKKKGVTLSLLHKEYEKSAKREGKLAYSYRSFSRKYTDHGRKYQLTMPIKKKPGEIMEVDWAGTTLSLMDRLTGHPMKVYVFVATLPFSMMIYAEAVLDMKSENWLHCHMHAYEAFGGVTESLIPDNLKTGVIKSHNVDPVLNESYRELAHHYGTTIIPALRNFQTFSLDELNEAIRKQVDEILRAPFQKRPGSRRSAFEEEEKPFLQPLPLTPFELSNWRVATVKLNYHIQVERMHYSVPFDYVKQQVEVKVTQDLVEVYFKNIRIASHKRLKGQPDQMVTNPDHMPDNHRAQLENTIQNNKEWAKTIGQSMIQFVDYIVDSEVERKALRILSSLKNLGRKYDKRQLEEAAETLLSIASRPTLLFYKTIIERLASLENDTQKQSGQKLSEQYALTRGPGYYGGKN